MFMVDSKKPLMFVGVLALAFVAASWFPSSKPLALSKTDPTANDPGGGSGGGGGGGGGNPPPADGYTLSAATGNPADQDVAAGTADRLCLAFNVRQHDGTGGALTAISVTYAATAAPGDWVSMRLMHDGDEIGTASSQASPVTFSGFSVPLTAADKTFEVLVTVSDNAVDGNVLQLSVSVSGLTFNPGGNVTGGAITGGAQIIFDGNALAELEIIAQPGNGSGGSALSQQPVIHLMNAFGELADDDDTTVVTAGIVAGSGTSGAQIVAGQTATAAGGIVTFDSLAIDRAGAGYQLVFSVGNLAGSPSEPFDVEVGPAVALRMLAQPGEAVANAAFGAQPMVELVDAGGNRVTADNITEVGVAILDGAGAAGAVLGGSAEAAVSEGVAAWQGLSINIVGSGYQLAFSAEGLEGAVSAPFQVAPSLSGGGGSVGAGGGGCALWLGSGQTSGPMPAGMLMLVGLLAVVGLVRRRKATA